MSFSYVDETPRVVGIFVSLRLSFDDEVVGAMCSLEDTSGSELRSPIDCEL